MIDISDKVLEAIALGCVTVLGISAIVIDGNVGEAILVTVAGAIGAFARHVWPETGVTTDGKENKV